MATLGGDPPNDGNTRMSISHVVIFCVLGLCVGCASSGEPASGTAPEELDEGAWRHVATVTGVGDDSRRTKTSVDRTLTKFRRRWEHQSGGMWYVYAPESQVYEVTQALRRAKAKMPTVDIWIR